jgi:hypothetical protein
MQIPPNDPMLRLAFYIGQPSKDRLKSQIETTAAHLREAKYPVTLKDLGPAPRPLSSAELDDLARWLDSLDRF